MDGLTPARQLADAFSNLLDATLKQAAKDRQIDSEGAAEMAAHNWKTLDQILMGVHYDSDPTRQLTADVIAAMMRENTGRSFLDSGGAYGRSFERNQRRAFENEPAASVEFRAFTPYNRPSPEVEPLYTRSVYHWLTGVVDFAPSWNSLFYDVFLPEFDPDGDHGWLENMTEFPLWLQTRGWEVSLAPYGEGDVTRHNDGDTISNTYNGDCVLSQTLQFGQFRVEYVGDDASVREFYPDGVVVLLQIHGGADVRGGYTRPIVFTARESDSLYSYNDGSLYCPSCGENWSTDDGYHWYRDGDSSNELRSEFVAVETETFGLRFNLSVNWTLWALYRLTHPSARRYPWPGLDKGLRRRIFGIPFVRHYWSLIDQTFSLPDRWLPWLMRHRDRWPVGKLVDVFITREKAPIFVDNETQTALCPCCHRANLEAF